VKEGANSDVDEIRKLVSGRLKKAVADGPHPDPNLLAAFAENALRDADRKRLLQHLGGCSDCREVLYLAMPDSAVAQKVPSFQPKRFSIFAWRWGTVAASIAIVAALFVTARHKATAPYLEQKAVVVSGAPASSQIASDKLPSELDQMRVSQNESRTETRIAPKPVPEPKHMTAKPKTELAFDSSGQVHMLPPPAQNAVQDEGTAAKFQNNYPVESAKKASEQRAKDLSRDDRKLTEAVEVSAGAVQVSEEKQTAIGLQLQKAAALPRAPQSVSGYQVNALTSVVAPQWKLSAKGVVQRSFNSGTTWQNATIAGPTIFRVVSAVGSDVWAGADAGVLYHSADSGQNWTRIEPTASGQKLTADITHIEFSDALNGTVSASNGEVWATSNGGQSWQRK